MSPEHTPETTKVVFGLNAVEEALESPQCVNRVYFAKESRAPRVDTLIERAKAGKIRFDFVPQAKLNEMTGSREHQGVAAAVSPVAYVSLEECLDGCGPTARLLALDRVQNPRNLGMLIRTAQGAGVSGVLLPARGAALLDDAVVRASAGAVFHVPAIQTGNLPQALRKLKEAGFWVFGLDQAGDTDLFEASWPERVILVLGNETEGIRPGVRKVCDALVSIPLAGGLESLNVAIAGAIALFQAHASHRRSTPRS